MFCVVMMYDIDEENSLKIVILFLWCFHWQSKLHVLYVEFIWTWRQFFSKLRVIHVIRIIACNPNKFSGQIDHFSRRNPNFRVIRIIF